MTSQVMTSFVGYQAEACSFSVTVSVTVKKNNFSDDHGEEPYNAIQSKSSFLLVKKSHYTIETVSELMSVFVYISFN